MEINNTLLTSILSTLLSSVKMYFMMLSYSRRNHRSILAAPSTFNNNSSLLPMITLIIEFIGVRFNLSSNPRGPDKVLVLERIQNYENKIQQLNNMEEKDFYDRFRMPRILFNNVCDIITPLIDVGPATGGRKRIPTKIQLALTLRYLAGATYLDIIDNYQVSKSVIYNILDRVCAAIIEKFPIKIPTREQANEYALKFCQKSDLTNCVGAIDGLLIAMEQKTHKDYGRKGFCGMNLQAIAGPFGEVLWFSFKTLASVPDGQALRLTTLYEIGAELDWLDDNR